MNTNVIFTLLRMLLVAMGGIVVAFLFPARGGEFSGPYVVASSIVVGAILALLMAQAAERRHRLMDTVRIELNKLRRVYHVGKNLSASSPRFRAWFTEIHGNIYEYLSGFSGKGFDAYDKCNAAFRKVSYHVYAVPEIETRKEAALYDDMLRTTASVAEARQQIKELWDGRISAYGWGLALLVAASYVVAILFTVGDTPDARIAAGTAIAATLVAIDYLREIDSLSSESDELAKRYVDNLSRLELGRRD